MSLAFACASGAVSAADDHGVYFFCPNQKCVVLSDASTMDRIHMGDIVISNGKWDQLQSAQLWPIARMSARNIALSEKVYAAIADKAQQLTCDETRELPEMQAGRLGIEIFDGHGNRKTCVLVPPASCRFLTQTASMPEAPEYSYLSELRSRLDCPK
jgi:hypothetical protein